MLRDRRGSVFYKFVVFIFSVALRLFFRRIETVNIETVPENCGLVFVMNHPNGLIDPALVFVALPRKISFLAKSTLFKMPVIKNILNTVDALPLYRRVDAGEDVTKNLRTFEMCEKLLQKGGAIALFPEGVSHNSPKMMPMKTGAARIAIGAVSVSEKLNLRIVPVGMFYTSKTTFRSEALLYFGESLPVKSVALDENNQPPRDAVRELTDEIEAALKEITVNAETVAEIETAEKAEDLFSSVYEGINLEQTLASRFTFIKQYISEPLNKRFGTEIEKDSLKKRINSYEKKLKLLNLEPENLSLENHSFWYVFRHFILRGLLLLLFLPFSIVGTILHFPAYQICKILAYFYGKHGVDDVVSSVKILAAMMFMPLTWMITAGILYFYRDWQIALISIPISMLCGYVALVSLEEFAELRGWWKAVWLFYVKRNLFLKLVLERRAIYQELENNEKWKMENGK